jgi:hypothetical protein
MKWSAIGLCVTLAACSPVPRLPPETVPPPSLAKATANIRTVAGQYHLTGQLEVAGPIEAPIVSTPPWVICLKSASQPRFSVALYYKADIYVSSHEATLGDHCDSQAFQALPN